MGYRRCKGDMSHTLAAYAGLRNLYSTAVTYHAFIADLFIFSTVALPVLAWSEDLLAEQTVFFRLQRSVVNGLRLGYLSPGPLENLSGDAKPIFIASNVIG